MDQEYIDNYPLGALAPGAAVPPEMAAFGATLQELGQAAGIDPDGLAEEVAKFNSFSQAGVDEDFGRGLTALHTQPPRRSALAQPEPRSPRPSALLRVPAHPNRRELSCRWASNRFGRAGSRKVGHPDPRPVCGGDCSAQLDIGVGYNSGIGNQRGLLYGYLAAKALTATLQKRE